MPPLKRKNIVEPQCEICWVTKNSLVCIEYTHPHHTKRAGRSEAMSPAQEQHLQKIKLEFDRQVDKKYRAGAKEHGGNLFDMPDIRLVENAMEEALDQYVYLYTLRDKIRQTIKLYANQNSTTR